MTLATHIDDAPDSGSNTDTALAHVHYDAIGKAIKNKDEAVAELRRCRKVAKGDGVDLKALDRVRALMQMDEHEIIAEHNMTVRYAGKMFGLPMYSQLELFEIPQEPTNTAGIIEKATLKGRQAGRMGESNDSADYGYDPGSSAGQAFLSGYHDGTETRLAWVQEIPVTPPKPEEPKRGRGRPKKDEAEKVAKTGDDKVVDIGAKRGEKTKAS